MACDKWQMTCDTWCMTVFSSSLSITKPPAAATPNLLGLSYQLKLHKVVVTWQVTHDTGFFVVCFFNSINHQTSRSRITKAPGTFIAAKAAWSGGQVTSDRWHITPGFFFDMWQVTGDTWHMIFFLSPASICTNWKRFSVPVCKIFVLFKRLSGSLCVTIKLWYNVSENYV